MQEVQSEVSTRIADFLKIQEPKIKDKIICHMSHYMAGQWNILAAEPNVIVYTRHENKVVLNKLPYCQKQLAS